MSTYLYVFGLGGVVFTLGLVYAWRQGYVGLHGRGLRALGVMGLVVAFFAGLAAWLQYAPMKVAAAVPYDGGADEVIEAAGRVRGTALDYSIMGGYFIAILAIGTWFGRRQKTTKDFFFGGQRFSWWLITFSLIATVVGSYSFVKYSNKGFGYGLSSSQTYLNDWIWLPLLLFAWLPILYFSRITSVPEYFGRRFGPKVRLAATVGLLVYLIGYVGVNLFTMGKVLNALIGWPIWVAALVVAVISATYVTAGGQTSVIMTDLFQGVMLLATGVLILILGMSALGGPLELWEHLPRESRQIFPNFNEDPDFPSVGIFWQDAIANSAMFYFLNQGAMMRFLAVRDIRHARKAAVVTVGVLMTVAAMVVGGGGWVARALVHSGQLPETVAADQAFYVAMEFLSRPGVFGLVLAALTAALMSTVDTLITAVAAVVVNDVYKPYVNPEASENQQLKIARACSISVTVLGVALVPLFMMFKSIYDAHGAFTAAVTPPLVVAFMLSLLWRRYTAPAALATILGGLFAVFASIVFPEIITPFAQGVPMKDVEDGFLVGMKQYKYMRAAFGISASLAIGVVVTLFTKPPSEEEMRGLVWGTVKDALRRYKGKDGDEFGHAKAKATPEKGEAEAPLRGEGSLPVVRISKPLAELLEAEAGDILYVSDARVWLGGLRSTHAYVDDELLNYERPVIEIGPETWENVVVRGREDLEVSVERLY
jgi:SSS family solute:Na+ symporter